MRSDADRAVSTAFSYVLLLAVATLLISGLLLTTGAFVDGQRERTAREGLSVTGQQAAAAIETADRLAVSADGTPSTLVVEQELARSVAEVSYTLTVNVTGSDVELELAPATPEVEASQTVTIPVANRTPVAEASLQGGPIEVNHTGTALEVRSDA